MADREGRGARQGDVDPVGEQPGLQLGCVKLLGARPELRFERSARLIGSGADLAPLLVG